MGQSEDVVGERRSADSRSMAAAEKVGPGVWSIPVPIPDNPLGYTLVYLLESSRGPVLVDAGWDDAASRAALTAGLRAAGTSIEDVYGVMVTHHHFDHYGLAHFVRDRSGAWVALHTADAGVLEQRAAQHGTRQRESLAEVFHAAGAPQAIINALPATENIDGAAPPPLPDRKLMDQQLVDVPGQQVRAVHTPGHTPGHTCFYLETQQRLLAGDQLLPSITPHVALYEHTGSDKDPLGDFLASLARLEALVIDEALPAHQYRFTAARARAKHIAEHHQARLREIETALQACPRTLWEVAERMAWNRPWSQLGPKARRMALSESAAHLQYLYRRHRVVTVSSSPVRYEIGLPGVAHNNAHRE